MKDTLPKIFTGFRKCHSAQHSSLITIEKWKRALDENMKVGAIFMNLSKARDTLNHLGFFWLNLKHSLQPTVLKQMENYLKTIRIALLLDSEKKKT